jgi:hypothetical protein
LAGKKKKSFYMPMKYTPLGVPASNAVLSITEKTYMAIETALRNVIPRLKPIGKCRATQKEITHYLNCRANYWLCTPRKSND